MHRTLRYGSLICIAFLIAACAETPPATKASSPAPEVKPAALLAPPLEPIPPKKDTDLRLFYSDGRILTGAPALARMPIDAQLTMWIAGNQFFAMEEVIHSFQKANPQVGNVAVITLPPGVVVKAIKAGGWLYEGKPYLMQPDIYASVDLGHLKALKAVGKMEDYFVYTHNQIELMVAKGNPKNIRGIDDLGRSDVRVMLPNPIDEGIMTFYAKKVLIQHKLWDKLSGGKECKACAPAPNVWFTTVHHREIPDALKAVTTDVGIVWATETKNALDEGAQVDKIVLPPQDSLINEVSYAIGVLKYAEHPAAAKQYLEFLKSPAGQAAYAKFGFVNATPADLSLKPIP